MLICKKCSQTLEVWILPSGRPVYVCEDGHSEHPVKRHHMIRLYPHQEQVIEDSGESVQSFVDRQVE
jgi:hypothetical protein